MLSKHAFIMTINNLDKVSRISLSNLDTPIEKCERLASLFPEGPEIFIKRDDFIGSLVWGNKLRKLEYSLADALEQGADTIITCGGIQSNHSRITAQVSKRLGLDCVLVQNGEAQEIPTGNHKINRMLDIPIHYVNAGEERDGKMFEVSEELLKDGKKPYIIPLGASNEIGCLGFVKAMEELKKQQEVLGIQFDAIIHASSSGGTQAGMEIGKRLFGMENLSITGISADSSVEELQNSILKCTDPLLKRIDAGFTIDKDDLSIDTSYIGPGYGIASDQSNEAEELFLKHEGIFLDTCYTAKAASALIDYCRNGKFKKGQKILFWHTGGILAKL